MGPGASHGWSATLSALTSGRVARKSGPRTAWSGRLVAIGVIGFSVLAAVASVAVRRVSAPSRNAELQRVIAEKAAEIAARHPRVYVEIRTDPPSAILEIDGQRVANPFMRSGAGDANPHQVTAALSGFDSVQQSVRFDHDHLIVLRLPALQKAAP